MTVKKAKPDLLLPLKGIAKRRPFGVVDLESKKHIETAQRHAREYNETLEGDEEPKPIPEGDISQEGGFERPFLIGFYDGGKFVSFRGEDCLKTMLIYLLSPKLDGMTYYAHNGGAFDWLHMLPILAASGYHFEISTVQSKIQMVKVKPHEDSHARGWVFLDSFQLIPAALEKIAIAFDTQVKKDGTFDYNVHEDDERWDAYLEKDCVSLYQTLMKFYELVEDALGGEVGMTTAATSMKTYRRNYQPYPIERHGAKRCKEGHIPVDQTLEKCDKGGCGLPLVSPHDFFRESYYGGRVEIFREEMTGGIYADINSSYPFSMLKDMPVGDMVEWEGEPAEWLLSRIGFARANVEVPLDTYIPVLPWRNDKGRLIFPVGKFSGVWPTIEIFRAIEMGAKVEWLESKWIKKGAVFEEMVNKLYSYRDKEKANYSEALSYTAKIMLNSLYGKFATNTLREKIVYIEPSEDPPEGAMPANPEDPECPIYTVEEEIDAPYIAPQIAAYITACSRLALHDLLVATHETPGAVLAYCDTDSVQGTADLSKFYGAGLGKLKDEGEGLIYDGTFLQPKLYALKGHPGPKMTERWEFCSGLTEDFPVPKKATHYETVWLPDTGAISFYWFQNGIDDSNGYSNIEKKKDKESAIPKYKGKLPDCFDVAPHTTVKFYQYKITMKGYRSRTKESFETIRLGGSLSFDSLEKIGAMVAKGFGSGPRVKTISRMIRGEDTKRRHINGITYPIVVGIGEDEELCQEDT